MTRTTRISSTAAGALTLAGVLVWGGCSTGPDAPLSVDPDSDSGDRTSATGGGGSKPEDRKSVV